MLISICPQDEILSTVGESAPLMYIDDTPVNIEVMWGMRLCNDKSCRKKEIKS